MGIHIGNKGKSGEREAIKWFSKRWPQLGELERNLDQTRSGGADILSIPGIAIEIKRQETLTVNTWWEQTKRQALATDRYPILMYRQNRKKWLFCIPASILVSESWDYITLNESVFEQWFNIEYTSIK